MRKLFTIDDFMAAFIAALGYGYGESIVAEEIISKVIFSKAVQEKLVNSERR